MKNISPIFPKEARNLERHYVEECDHLLLNENMKIK